MMSRTSLGTAMEASPDEVTALVKHTRRAEPSRVEAGPHPGRRSSSPRPEPRLPLRGRRQTLEEQGEEQQDGDHNQQEAQTEAHAAQVGALFGHRGTGSRRRLGDGIGGYGAGGGGGVPPTRRGRRRWAVRAFRESQAQRDSAAGTDPAHGKPFLAAEAVDEGDLGHPLAETALVRQAGVKNEEGVDAGLPDERS